MVPAPYQLQARAVVVDDGRIRRDDTRVIDGHDLGVLRCEARLLSEDGFTAWLFRRERPGLAAPLRLLETLTPRRADITMDSVGPARVPAARR